MDGYWDAWYAWLTGEHGLSKRPAFVGMSMGGVNAYEWSTRNPEKVSCIYADNPAIRPESFAKLELLAKHDVALFNVCGSQDFLLDKHTLAIENRYRQLGGRVTVMIKEGAAHHPHSLRNAKPIADWIEQHAAPAAEERPGFASDKFAKSYYYSAAPAFVHLPEEDTYAAARGPGFVQCYARYDAKSDSRWETAGMGVIVPKSAAAGKPWVFRASPIERDAAVDQALLAQGFHIVIAPLVAQSGPVRGQWDATYRLLVDAGFSQRPVMEGAGAAAGEVLAWAGENPDKVSCVYVENPALRSLMSKTSPLDNLGPLAKRGAPIVDARLDPTRGIAPPSRRAGSRKCHASGLPDRRCERLSRGRKCLAIADHSSHPNDRRSPLTLVVIAMEAILLPLLGIAVTYIGFGPFSRKKNPTAGAAVAVVGFVFRLAGPLLLVWAGAILLFVMSMTRPPRHAPNLDDPPATQADGPPATRTH